ncbi:hypothetical protein SSX86_023760 [Deinandra increscens subsp. villosa]|uniref:non-specific serine/threonine protein kinase n=1 Tax=Deinandra increscens subsp. villosa TaxID=3103831 RepID=A0AAP0CRL9_9ASTR
MGKIMTETPKTAEELLKRIQKLEQDHRHLLLKQHLMMNLHDTLISEMNILQSMGQSVHMFDLNQRIIYWNQMAENLYGYSVAEALGKSPLDIIVGSAYSELSILIIQRVLDGETWSGQFPVKPKFGENVTVITTLSPCRDENGTTFGVTCVSADARQFRESSPQSTAHHHHHQPLQNAIVSKISNLASKVKLKMKANNMEHDSYFPPTTDSESDSNEGSENGPRFPEVFSVKAEAWMGEKGISWPWKANRDSSHIIRPTRFGWPWLHYRDLGHESDTQTSSSAQHYESPRNIKQTPGSSSSDSCGTSASTNKTDIHFENLDVEISWDDLIIREQIGQGTNVTVYHALLYGSDVAVKIFNKQEYPDDAILSFRKEVCLMKRLRYPNILLFMGAVVSPQHLCIVTEFLPRGSLFSLLQRSTTKLDWRCRVHMAIDIARGMNYLHHCQPPIIHRNLKSSNLLVGEFGLSRIKHETYLTTNTKTGMPQWMAPEVLRNEQVDEKSDVYSYGVVLWEITTGKIPWENLNSMQVIGAVGFMNQHLEIPNDVDPQWASLIENCWSREPQSRLTFKEILINLKDLQKKFKGPCSYKKGGS